MTMWFVDCGGNPREFAVPVEVPDIIIPVFLLRACVQLCSLGDRLVVPMVLTVAVVGVVHPTTHVHEVASGKPQFRKSLHALVFGGKWDSNRIKVLRGILSV